VIILFTFILIDATGDTGGETGGMNAGGGMGFAHEDS
jgi:hypothetical protein